MKKSKFIALALTLAIALSGVGFAYWSDALTINNNVTTGEFDVSFIRGANDFNPRIVDENVDSYVTESVSQTNDKTTSFTIGNMYPGTVIRYEMNAKNLGTIPAVFDNAVIKINPWHTSPHFLDVLQMTFAVRHYDANGGLIGTLTETGWFSVYTLEATINTLLKDLRLEPGEIVSFDFTKISLPASVGNTNPNEYEKQTAIFDITVNWKQHNVQ